MPPKKMTEKDKLFVEEYLVDLDARASAIRAGFSKTTAKSKAHEWVGQSGSKPLVYAAIQKAIKKRSERAAITQDYVLEAVQETLERCRQVYPVLDKDGNRVLCETPKGEMVPAFVFDAKGVYKGSEMLGKHLGMFEDDKGKPGEIHLHFDGLMKGVL